MVQLLLSYQRRWALRSVNAWSTLFVQFNMSIWTCKWLIKETARLFHVQFNTLTANTKKSSKLNSCPIKQVNCIGIGLHALNETLFKIIVILRRLSFGWFVFSIVACIQKVSTNLFSEKRQRPIKLICFLEFLMKFLQYWFNLLGEKNPDEVKKRKMETLLFWQQKKHKT